MLRKYRVCNLQLNRCSSIMNNLSRVTSGSCTTATITSWAKDISTYIKSIDSNHLVGLGDEGFFNEPNGPNFPYQYIFLFLCGRLCCSRPSSRGGEGIDFDANLAISSIDFGTYHVCHSEY